MADLEWMTDFITTLNNANAKIVMPLFSASAIERCISRLMLKTHDYPYTAHLLTHVWEIAVTAGGLRFGDENGIVPVTQNPVIQRPTCLPLRILPQFFDGVVRFPQLLSERWRLVYTSEIRIIAMSEELVKASNNENMQMAWSAIFDTYYMSDVVFTETVIAFLTARKNGGVEFNTNKQILQLTNLMLSAVYGAKIRNLWTETSL